MSPIRSPPGPYLAVTDPDLESSIVLESGAVHENAMPSGPLPSVPRPASEKTERIPLKSADYPSAANGADIRWKARKVYGFARRLLKLRLSVVPVPVNAAEPPEACGAGGGGGPGLSVEALRAVPPLSLADRVEAAAVEDVRVALGEIMAKLALAEEGFAEPGGGIVDDAVLVTVYDFLEGGGTGYIEMATAYGWDAEQDLEISHAGARF